MRVLMVSAHYPPNFTSGGTLQPARLAAELGSRGHDVSVYAGRLDDDAMPLWSSETVENGVAVRWINISHFLAWNDDRNWDNPGVTADFAAHLARLDPDVVHIHSLQSLGVGVLREAVRHRARVVVTMHDFWWLCARTFLVDRTWRPCPVVTDCGDCPCELGQRWRVRRSEALRSALAGADVILGPSHTAVEVLAANGFVGARCDENGMSLPEPSGARPPRQRGPLRVLYAGGPDPMKGAHVVPAIAARVGSGVRITAHGLDPDRLDAKLLAAAGEALELRPAFTPAESDAVFAEVDVLAVPSLMRETFSLITREALGRGIPVVCTDSLGPEEVVVHGHNGLVVPAADPESLADDFAAALAALATDSDLAERLAAGAAEGVEVRSIAEQAEGLERIYTAPVAGPAAAAQVRRVCFVVGIEGAPLRYRAQLPAEALGLLGVDSDLRWYRDPDLVSTAMAADAVVLYRVPATVEVLELVERLQSRGIPVLYDLDDMIFDPDLAPEIPALGLLSEPEAELWLDGVRRYRTVLERADVFIGSTAPLVEHAAAVVPDLVTERFDNGVGTLGARAAQLALERSRQPGPLRIGYFSGTTTHDDDWAWVAAAVAEVIAQRPEVELWLGGHLPDLAELAPVAHRTRRFGVMGWTDLLGVMRDLDVNLAPLAPGSRFNEAKSAIKWLEAALVATPTVASPTLPFSEAITDGRNGLLAGTPEEWSQAISALLDDAGLRTALGRRAMRDAMVRWAPRRQGERYLALLERAARHHAGKGARRRSSWEPVAPSEPTEPAPHRFGQERLRIPPGVRARRGASVAASGWDRALRQGRGYADRAKVLAREEGLAGPLRGALRVARRLGPG